MTKVPLPPHDDRPPARIGDARDALSYLLAPEADQYIAIMDVLEASIVDVTPSEVAAQVRPLGVAIDAVLLEARLEQLKEWGAVSARADASKILRFADLLGRNFRYCATPAGRHVQRFYRKVLAGTATVREIPLPSLARVVEAAEELATPTTPPARWPELIGRLFVNHDDLDGAMVGAEDSLAGLVDRFDLDDETTAELKAMVVSYATHVALELDRGAARAFRALRVLQPRFHDLSTGAVAASDARVLIERGALTAARGGRIEDWDGLLTWFAPATGRCARFGLRLVRALPGMHANLRRLHSSSGSTTTRSRALALARACAAPEHGTAIFLAALGDHRWRKLYGESDDAELSRIVPWSAGPTVAVPDLLRLTGRSGARGRAPAARDDTAAREAVLERRRARAAAHDAAIREVLASPDGAVLSESAARVALASLIAAVRAASVQGRRTGERDGLACTLFHTPATMGTLRAPTWRILTPCRVPVFHLRGQRITSPVGAPDDDDVEEPRLIVVGK